ncbi:MAG: AraC family transcriptional regulator [Christensenellaceae bacterium]|nr:AraC family transcriptional regulator [Christensenellaceae bacterium]
MQEQIEAVQRMQEHIQAHLGEPITPANLARASRYSPWHACRLFARLTGLSPADYIRRLRLSRSALLLKNAPGKVAEVAFSLGFQSVDGYQRAFLREFGRNPGSYARDPSPLYLFMPYGVKFRQPRRRIAMQAPRTVFVSLVEKPARRLLLKRGVAAADYFAYCEEVGCDVWGLLQSIEAFGGEPICLWLPPAYRKPNTSEYVQGAELPLEYEGAVPEGFELIELPAAPYLMFQGEPFAEENFAQAIEELRGAAAKYDPSRVGCAWEDGLPRVQLEPIGARGYIELLPVRRIRP